MWLLPPFTKHFSSVRQRAKSEQRHYTVYEAAAGAAERGSGVRGARRGDARACKLHRIVHVRGCALQHVQTFPGVCPDVDLAPAIRPGLLQLAGHRQRQPCILSCLLKPSPPEPCR